MSADARGSVTPQMLLGVIITLLGALLLIDNLNIFEARHILHFWPTVLIVLGVMVFMQSREIGGQINGGALATVGLLLLLNRLGLVAFEFWNFFWPSLLILVGTRLIIQTSRQEGMPQSATETVSLFAVWGGNQRTCNSPTFKGGDMTAIMGGCELDLRPASIEPGQTATLDLLAVMGGHNIWVPEDWAIVTRVIPFMGGIVDKRPLQKPGVATKTLVLRGFVLMGGVEIKG